MISSILYLFGKVNYPLFHTYALGAHTVPLSDKDQRVPFPAIKEGPLFNSWSEFKSLQKLQDVKLLHGFFPTISLALGNSLFANSPKVVAIDAGIELIDDQAAMFFSKHEFAHIKDNDSLIQHGLLLITSIAASLFCKTWYFPLCLGLLTSLVAERIFGRRAESNADSFAIENATEEELKGAIRFFEAIIQADEHLLQSYSFLTRITSLFGQIFDRHPSYRDRMTKVTEGLKSRFRCTRIELDKNHIQKLKEYILLRNTMLCSDPEFKKEVEKIIPGIKV